MIIACGHETCAGMLFFGVAVGLVAKSWIPWAECLDDLAKSELRHENDLCVPNVTNGPTGF